MLHCAFAGCSWTYDATGPEDSIYCHWGQEWKLFGHLLSDHENAFDEEFELCKIADRFRRSNLPAACPRRKKASGEKWQDDLFLHVITNYMKAVCIRLEQGMPDVGPSVDRRVLRGLNTIMPNVKSMICFCCAQIHGHVPLWSRMYKPGQHGDHTRLTPEGEPDSASPFWSEHAHSGDSQNGIEMRQVRYTLRRFYMRNERNFRLHFDLGLFKERYASDLQPDGNPFRNSRLLDQDDEEWVQRVHLDVEAEPVFVLCCPEDVQKRRECKRRGGRLCNDCWIPLCSECDKCIGRGETSEIPMALANDNMWGYTSDLIFGLRVRYLEMAIVQPVWTTMMVCYVEGDRGHLLNEEVDKQQYRTRVRGTAHSFHMPWEEIMEELRKQCLEKSIMEPLPRKPECLKYVLRVHLRVDQHSMEKALRQLTVRPYVLLQLLYYLIDHNHVVFRGRGSAQQLRSQMQAAVERYYRVPVGERSRPVEEQEWHLPGDFFDSISESQLLSAKRPFLLKEKNATPGEGAVSVESCFGERRPSSVVSETSGQACSTPAKLRTSTICSFGAVSKSSDPNEPSAQAANLEEGRLVVRTGHKLLPQWEGKYFSTILPFVIPYMVSGPDFNFADLKKRWRRGAVGGEASDRFLPAPWVAANTFVAGFARRCESQCRRDWTALPIIRSVIFKHTVETAGNLFMSAFSGRRNSIVNTSAAEIVADAKVLCDKLWNGVQYCGPKGLGLKRPINGDTTRLSYADGLTPRQKQLAREVRLCLKGNLLRGRVSVYYKIGPPWVGS